MILTYVLAFYLSVLNEHLVDAQGGSTNFLHPGKPVKGEEDTVEEVSSFKRFLHKLGVDLDPSDVIVGLVILALIAGAAFYFIKMKKGMPPKEEEDI